MFLSLEEKTDILQFASVISPWAGSHGKNEFTILLNF